MCNMRINQNTLEISNSACWLKGIVHAEHKTVVNKRLRKFIGLEVQEGSAQ